MSVSKQTKTYQQMAQLVAYFIQHQQSQPRLSDLADEIGLSEFHLQKIFSQWVGVSPKQFLKFLTKEHAKKVLRHSSVFDAALEAGLSGSGRLHDLMITCEGVTPGEFKKMGEGLLIEYGVGESPFGSCFVAFTGKGICKLAFYDEESERSALFGELEKQWPYAQLEENQTRADQWLQRVFTGSNVNVQQPLHLIMKGSPFQLQVWQALLSVPQGELRSYQQIADQIGKPRAVRAVASAIANNHIGYLIPCHRVIRSSGEFSQYRWGEQRKPVMIAWEAAKASR